MLSKDDVTARLKAAFPDGEVMAHDLTGSGDHWRVEVYSPDFADKTLVSQHQQVYRALADWLPDPIHALSLETGVTRSPTTAGELVR